MTGHRHYTRWPIVEGYPDRQSYAPGDTVALHLSSRAERVTVEVARVGLRRDVVWAATGVRVGDHAVPDEAWAVGCDWPVAITVPIDQAWPSGFYEVRMVAEDHSPDDPSTASEAGFVVRAPAGAGAVRRADGQPPRPLLVLSTNTWNAYNQWGGACAYSGAARLSFQRPIERGYLRRPAAPDEVDFDGRVTNIDQPSDPEHRRLVRYQAGNHYPLWTASSGWHNWERRFARWAESAGVALDYATNADLDPAVWPGPGLLDGRRLLLSVGHDEYWSWGMRDTVDRFVAGGGNLAVLSGNTCFWQVRYEDDGKTMVCHKGRARLDDPVRSDPDRQHLLTSMWSDPRIGRPEPSTTGLTFTRGGYHRIGLAVPEGSGAYTVHRPDHWALDGTGLAIGDPIGAGSYVVGYEVDGCAMTDQPGDSGGEPPRPTGEDGVSTDLEIVATAPARLISITDDHCEAPADLWASLDPPGDLEGTAMILFGDASPASVERLARGHAVMGSVTKPGHTAPGPPGSAPATGTVFNAGSADWAYGLDRDATVQRITANVLRHLGGVRT
ncbi:MAG: N,N-dimethylformamidase beta subunit family domain-containing protein [Actinomycetota bacterium]